MKLWGCLEMRELRVNSEVVRVFGDSELSIEVDGDLVKVTYNSLKSMRFIESLLVGKKYFEAPYIASRVCGACSQAHFWASVLAAESAVGIEVTEDTAELRDICNKIEIIQNHVVHLAFMALKDYVTDVGNVVKLAIKLNTGLVKALELIGGRLSNPNVYKPGGFTDKITVNHIRKSLSTLKELREDLSRFADYVLNIQLPTLRDPSPLYLALSNAPKETVPKNGYALVSSLNEVINVRNHRELLSEIEVMESTSRKCMYRGDVFYVGPRARISNLTRRLGNDLQIKSVDLSKIELNPFMNIYAKALECRVMLEDVINSLDNLSARNLRLTPSCNLSGKEGVGLGMVEAPRGLLIHHYKVNDELRIVEADIITPTVMNTLHIERSAQALVKYLIQSGNSSEDVIKKVVESLVRAYDPCIVCAVHVIKVR